MQCLALSFCSAQNIWLSVFDFNIYELVCKKMVYKAQQDKAIKACNIMHTSPADKIHHNT